MNTSPKILLLLFVAVCAVESRQHSFVDKTMCPPNKCMSCDFTTNQIQRSMTCNFCYGYERQWKDTSNKNLRGAQCTDNKIDKNALPNCLIAQPINDQVTENDESEELRADWEIELENRYQVLLHFNSAENAFVKSFGEKLAKFKQGSSIRGLLGEPNADRICLSCEKGYYLDFDGKCKLADNLDFCEVFSGKSTCLYCMTNYWMVKKTDTLTQCVKADMFLRVRNCQYNGMYLQNQSATCSRCERGFVLGNAGKQCVLDNLASARGNIGGMPGCLSDYGAFSIGIYDYDKNKQICRYTWLLPPFSLHLAISILIVCSIVCLIYFTVNPVKKSFKPTNYGNPQPFQQNTGDYQNMGNADHTIETSPEATDTENQRENQGNLQLSLDNSQNLKSE